ncbi:phosphoribosyltransferase family protein [Planococcus salinus]|uniref:Adenine/guanine phosphoribosyltransferase n=1 Tax=Planococcus salinus TaxID=1848460 RepID=A0A3M8PAL3_9BACL|nr:phosphoribosyltransferase family protein [Planococcus salinus]RNF40270.1 adenine/guanine phosphoribosyltransferase [Planococcus salinus]
MKTIKQSMSSTISVPNNFQTNYKYWDKMDINVKIHRTYEGLTPDSLFAMALRINKKRQFLFVSKLIAKHLAVHPSLALGTGTLLASLLMESAGDSAHPQTKEIARMIESQKPSSKLMRKALEYRIALSEKTLFLGMAETATGLGHAVFQHFKQADYIHTTREEIKGQTPSFVFQEEHSHATDHKVYAPAGMLEKAETIVLVDDEISTGNTLINLIGALDDQYPGKEYKCLSILDWRNDSQKKTMAQMAESRGIHVEVLALMAGEFELIHSESPEEESLDFLSGTSTVLLNRKAEGKALPYSSQTQQRYLTYTGRFGLDSSTHAEIGSWAQAAVKTVESGAKPLVIGIGENMYLPLRFALELDGAPLVQTATRSPIYASDSEGYPIKEKAKFSLPDAEGIDHFLYNVNRLDVDKIYLLAESVIDEKSWQPLLAYLEKKAPVEWISMTAAERSAQAE